MRPLRVEDAETLSSEFSAMGWSKPTSIFLGYVQEQAEGVRWARVATICGRPAGYVTVRWVASDPWLRSADIPEIMDLNVLPAFRRRGLGTVLMDAAEAEAAARSSVVGLRMGLHSGYGAAQRLYARRGYVPDGAGALAGDRVAEEGATIQLDDDVTLRMLKAL